MKWQLVSTHVNLDLPAFRKLSLQIKSQWGDRAIVALSGEMAAGKTEFVKALFPEASSPTFAIHQNYGEADHLDLFRIQNEDELESTGFWDLLSKKSGFIFIEWSENMDLEHIPMQWPLWKIEIQKESEELRRVEVFRR
jgi:tRNA threonylcarbamoyladenosine biosynthesis protein TsaE